MEYEAGLKRAGKIDFADMIGQATKIVQSGFLPTKYRYIIVDEFQDISFGRYAFIEAIKDKAHAKIFCVGDDWQSIYRFSGSDVDFIARFALHFGYSKILKIEKTYRFSQQLISVVEPFIMANPSQLKKQMRSDKILSKPVRLVRYQKDMLGALNHAVDEIIAKYGDQGSIALLMRNSFDADFLKEAKGWNAVSYSEQRAKEFVYEGHTNLKIFTITVHSAKGLEADNVILINAENKRVGFPNKIADDTLLQLVLSHKEQFDYAEERRLFYVALTRTKNCSYILTPDENPSVFISDIIKAPELETLFPVGEKLTSAAPICPVCQKGHLLLRTGPDEKQFVGCSMFPMCTNTYDDTSVLKYAIRCRNCGGYMVHRRSTYGVFVGCSNFPHCQNKYPSLEAAMESKRQYARDQYTVCQVKFRTSSQLYSYLTNDPTLHAGESVLVPNGSGGTETVIIKQILHCTKDTLPYPLAGMKSILGRATQSLHRSVY